MLACTAVCYAARLILWDDLHFRTAAYIPSVDRQAELAEARAKNPDTAAWLYIPSAEIDDPVMQAEDNGYYLKLDENGEYAMWGC